MQTLIQTTDFKQLCFDVTWLRWSTLKNIDFAVVLDGWNCGDMLFFFLNELRKLWGAIPQNKTHTQQTNKQEIPFNKKTRKQIEQLGCNGSALLRRTGPWSFMIFYVLLLKDSTTAGCGGVWRSCFQIPTLIWEPSISQIWICVCLHAAIFCG